MTPLQTRDLSVLWHPCAQMQDYQEFPPLEVVAAEGSRIHLADGRVLIDAISSWWCKALGHCHPRLMAALRRQSERFDHVILANTTNEEVVRLCERLCAIADGAGPEVWGPGGDTSQRDGRFSKVFLADNGSTAVEVALKMALQAHKQSGRAGRVRFAALRGGYHGETAGCLSVSDCALYKEHYGEILFEPILLGPVPYRSGGDDPLWQDCSEEWPGIQDRLDRHASELAAIVYEPILQGAGGMRVYSPDLLRRLRAWADAHGVYLIADEIAAGMGRCGCMLAGEHAGAAARPDFAVVSKGLTGGALPLSAVVTTQEIYDCFLADYREFKAFLHSNTYTGNALAVAVANAALDVFAEDDLLGRVAAYGPLLRSGLKDLAGDRPYLHHLRSVGMMAAIDICKTDGSPLDWRARTGYQVYREAVRRGALLRPLGDALYLFPPLTTDPEDLEIALRVLHESLDAVMAR